MSSAGKRKTSNARRLDRAFATSEALAQTADAGRATRDAPTSRVLDYLYTDRPSAARSSTPEPKKPVSRSAHVVRLPVADKPLEASPLKKRDERIYNLLLERAKAEGGNTCVVSLPELSQATGFSISGVQYVIRRLEALRLIEKKGMCLGWGKRQGNEYQVNPR